MSPEQLFDLFVTHGVTVQEVAKMNLSTLQRQIRELRTDPDDIRMTHRQIAKAMGSGL